MSKFRSTDEGCADREKSGAISRRALFAGAGGAAALGLFAQVRRKTPASAAPKKGKGLRVVVVGAGAFGGWTALHLLRRGAKVTLVDSWGPGNSRASSGGETRVIRGVYGASRIYTAMAARAFVLWKENEERWKRKLYRRTGALWMLADEGKYVRDALPLLKDSGFPFEELSLAEAARRYPQISFTGLQWALVEKEAGFLLARQSCAVVVEGFLAEGGEYRQASVTPGVIESGSLAGLRLSDGARLSADVYVFACGPWLPQVFPEAIGSWIQPTRQEVFFFGTPGNDQRFNEDRMPVWVEVPRFMYGIPGNERRGFKIADDSRGPDFDPTNGERLASPESLKAAREYVAMRFPALARAPVVETRVCQYENSPDHDFLVDRHPGAGNAWLVGGGSGHGFKHGPALGELVAQNVLGEKPVEPLFSYARLKAFPRPKEGKG
jgi:glycine/D-amino acid oxidase-like deaminating enzyme